NAIAHADAHATGKPVGPIVEFLAGRRLCRDGAYCDHESMLERIATRAIARWACNTARAIQIEAVGEKVLNVIYISGEKAADVPRRWLSEPLIGEPFPLVETPRQPQ